MQEVFEKIKSEIRNLQDNGCFMGSGYDNLICRAIEIVNQVAEEYNQSLANNNQLLTNADKIHSMSDEELAEFLPIVSNYMCQPTDKCREIIFNRGECCKTKECALCWLQSKAEE